MKTLILYCSNTGTTKNYAEQIGRAMGTEAMPLEKKTFRKLDLSAYDTIVFGGWVQGGVVQGIDDFLSRWDEMETKNVLIFAVGISAADKTVRENLIASNALSFYHLRFYQLRGSFDYSKLKFPKTLMFKAGLASAKRAAGDNANAGFLDTLLETPLYYNDEEGVNRIVSVLHRLEAEGSK